MTVAFFLHSVYNKSKRFRNCFMFLQQAEEQL